MTEVMQTFVGSGFGTLARSDDGGSVPAVASARGTLRNSLPAVYRSGDVLRRFLTGLEQVHDPIVAMLDSLPAHVDPWLAPRHHLPLLASWMATELDESQTEHQQRETIARAAEVARLRGTRAGLELALHLYLPDLPLRVIDHGRVEVSQEEHRTASGRTPSSFAVLCDSPLTPDQRADVLRCIDDNKPIHVSFTLKVRRCEEQLP